MNSYEQVIDTLTPLPQDTFTAHEIKKLVSEKHGTNQNSIIPSDYCYNRTTHVIKFNKHILIYLSRGNYQFVGENYPYNGPVYQKPQGETVDSVVGEWKDGVFTSSRS